MGRISMASRVVAVSSQATEDIGGESAIVELKSGVYYGTDDVGAEVWKAIQEPKSVSQVREHLLSEFDVDRETCERDLLAFLEELASAKLIDVLDEPESGR